MQLLDALKENLTILEIARVSTRMHCVEKSPWKRLWICRKTEYNMKE
jgi:hypothetical protein